MVERRRLDSFDECVAHYPNKTLRGAVRRLRLQLLPTLLQWTRDGAFPRYSQEDNEKFHLESLAPDVREALRLAWLHLEPRLIDLLAQPGRADRNALFRLVAKGKAIFETQGLECRGAFAEHVRRCTESRLLPEPLAAEVVALSNSILPPAEAGHLQLKGYIHRFAHVPRHGGCSLKQGTVDYLARSCPDVLRGLPGYVEPREQVRGRFRLLVPARPKHSPQLYGLFDQTVFGAFHFLRTG